MCIADIALEDSRTKAQACRAMKEEGWAPRAASEDSRAKAQACREKEELKDEKTARVYAYCRDTGGLQWVLLALLLGICSAFLDLSSSSREGGSHPTTCWWRVARTLVLELLILVAASCHEALRDPRPPAFATWEQFARTLLQIAGDFLLIPLYGLMPAEVPTTCCQATLQNAGILARCPSLRSFKQTPWLRNPYIGFGALMLGDLGNAGLFKKFIRREVLEAQDGGLVAMDWWEEEGLSAGTEVRGVLFVGSTFVGDALGVVTRSLVRHFTARGWKCVVMVRRGCGLIMPNLQKAARDPTLSPCAPWDILGQEDLHLALDHVARVCPGLPICGVGLSTGAWQLKQYVALQGKQSKLSAVVLLDSGPDWDIGTHSLDIRCPLVSQALGKGAGRTFSQCGLQAPGQDAELDALPGPYGNCARPGGILAFTRDRLATAHGYARDMHATSEYLKTASAAVDLSDIAVPTLGLVSFKDTLMTPDAVQDVLDGYKASPHLITVGTREGTHMMRWQGWKPQCWVSATAYEFLEAALYSQSTKATAARGGA